MLNDDELLECLDKKAGSASDGQKKWYRAVGVEYWACLVSMLIFLPGFLALVFAYVLPGHLNIPLIYLLTDIPTVFLFCYLAIRAYKKNRKYDEMSAKERHDHIVDMINKLDN